ncbi:MAG: hypothetical protein ACYTAS_12930 [Planctomycetota bacterium]
MISSRRVTFATSVAPVFTALPYPPIAGQILCARSGVVGGAGRARIAPKSSQ